MGVNASGRGIAVRSLVLNALVLPVFLIVAAAGGVPGEPPAGPQSANLVAHPWFYLRDDRPLGPGERPVELLVVGDVMLGRGVAAVPDPLGAVAATVRAADVAWGNFEGVIAAAGNGATPEPLPPRGAGGPYPLLIPPERVPELVAAGFDALGLANNHTLDRGPYGLRDTAEALRSAGLRVPGAGPDAEAAWAPVFFPVRGVTLGVLACNAVPHHGWRDTGGWGPAPCEPELAEAAIRGAREQAQAVIVSVHWGYEYDRRVDPGQETLANRLLAAGADVVIGHHPHVVQATRVVPADPHAPVARDRFVAYSLGNFVFDQADDRTDQGLALRIFLDRQGLRAVQALPLQAGLRPRILAATEAAGLLRRAAPAPRLVAFTCDQEACRPAAALPSGRVDLPDTAQIDLTGDGLPEHVLLAGHRAVVRRDGRPVWTSPPDWRVLDLAAGDPNDDGRFEVLLALEKPDETGVLRSHPFIVGYRGGAYRVLWGGSALHARLLEVELGDVDGDGDHELVTLEASGAGEARALGVWDWHGWGFSLRWRGPAGRWEGLHVAVAGAGEPARVQVSSPSVFRAGR